MLTAIPGSGRVPVGRDVELAAAEALLGVPGTQLITFTGPAGVGKTCVAVDVAGRTGRHCVFVDAEGIVTWDGLLRAVATAALVASPTGALEQVLAADSSLSGAVVVIDGCQHADEAPHPVSRLLALLGQIGGVDVLATSLAPLKVEGEQVVGLDPLPVGTGDEAARSAAVRLFCARAEEVDPRFDPDTADLVTIAALCGRVHGMPLGIELLATRMVSQPVAEILETLDHGLEVGNERARSAPEPRRHSLRLALDWSYRSLDAASAALLRRMSVFETPATVDMLACVLGASPAPFLGASGVSLPDLLDVVADLVDHRLVEPYDGAGEPAFGLVDLIRDFAGEQLVDAGEWGPVETAHTRAMLDFALSRHVAVDAAVDEVAMGELTRAERDLRTALRRATGAADVSDGIRLTIALAPYVLRRGYDGLVGHPLAGMLARAESTGVAEGLVAGGMLWSARLAMVFAGPAEKDLIKARLVAGTEHAREAGDQETLLLGLSFVMLALPATGDLPMAVAAATEGLALAEAADDPRWGGRFCGWAGMIAHQSGDTERAVELAARGLDHVDRVPDPRALMVLAMLVAGLPAEHKAGLSTRLPPIEELLATARRLRDRRYEAHLSRAAAGTAIRLGDLDRAAGHVVDALRLVEQQGTWHDLPFTTLNLAVLAILRGDLEEGARFYGTIQLRMDDLRTALPPGVAERYGIALDEARDGLGEERFEELVREGELLSHGDRLTAQIAYAEGVSGRHGPPVAGEVTKVPAQRSVPPDSVGVTEGGLTQREGEVLQHIVTGMTNQEIGHRLGLAPKTVMHHTSAIYRKLGVRGRAEATALAFRRGLTS